ncbi:hypothetical protein OEZ86_004254 [Tetradesmus obliquus]|nr:hypothetical protein OEZ86_004254 [Tetradesmus obliquus]
MSACSGNRTTLGTNRVRCSGCKPGFGGLSCDMCKPGFWSRGGSATAVNACRACPDGTFTLGGGATAQAACRSTTIAINTTIPVNLTTVAVFTLGNATCGSGFKDALVAKYNEEKQKAAAADGFKINFVTEVVNCTEVAGSGSGSGRKRSTIGTFAVMSTSSTISSVTFIHGVNAGTALNWLNIIGNLGVNSGDAFFRYWGAVGQSYETAALQSLASGGVITSGGLSFGIVSADVSQFQLSGSNGGPIIIISNNEHCLNAPAPSLWQLPAGVDLAVPAWQLACGSTPRGQSCTAAACDKGNGSLTAACGQDGKWSGGTGSCTALTCEWAAPPGFPANGASFSAAAWSAACGSTLQGNECVTSAACSSGQKLSATCEYLPVAGSLTATWTKLAGSCTTAASPVQCSSAPANVPTLGGAVFWSEPWIAKCGQTQENATCTVLDAACSAGGTITAQCVKGATGTGVWTGIQGACKAPTASVQCMSAPQNVPKLGGSVFLSEPWIASCGKTQENVTCSVVDAACSSGGTISAKCSKDANGVGVWTDVQGSCRAPAPLNATAACGTTPMPSAAAGWATNGAPLNATAWAAACSQTVQGQTCSAAACGGGFSGTLSAVCQGDGQWGQLSGTCSAGTCSGAPSPVPTTGGASFIAGAWASACSSTTRGNSCSTSNACSDGSTGTINALCDSAGNWQLTSGGCTAGTCSGAPDPGSMPTTGGASFIAGTCSGAPGSVPTTGGASFIAGAWATACSSTTRGNSCSTSNACSAGSTGTINATCTAAGTWTYTSGTCVAGLASAQLTTTVGSSSWTCSSSTPGTLTFSASSPDPLGGGNTLNIGPSNVITVGKSRGLELRLVATATGSTSCSAILNSIGGALQAGLLQDVSPSGGAAALSVASGSIPDIQLQCSKQLVGTFELRAIITYLSPASSGAGPLAVADAVNTGQLCTTFPTACSALSDAGSGLTLAAGQSTAETFDPAAPQPRLEISSTCPTLAATKLAVTVSNPVKPLDCTVAATYSCPGLLDLGGVNVTLSAGGTAAAGLACSPAIGSSQMTPAAGGSRRQLNWRCDNSNTPGDLTFFASSTIPAPLAGFGPAAGPTIPITIGQPQGVEVLFAATLDCDNRAAWSFPEAKKLCTDAFSSAIDPTCANNCAGPASGACDCIPSRNECRAPQVSWYPCTPNFRCSTPAVASAIASIQTNMLAYIQSKKVNGGSNGNVVAGGTQVVVTCADRLFTGGGYRDAIRPRAMTSATAGFFGPGSFHLRIITNYLTNSASTALADSIVSTLMGTNPPGSDRDYSSTPLDSGVLRFCGGADELSFICTSWSAAGPEFDMSRRFKSTAGVPLAPKLPELFAATTFDPTAPARRGMSAYPMARDMSRANARRRLSQTSSNAPVLNFLTQPQPNTTIIKSLSGCYTVGSGLFGDEMVPAIAYVQPGVAPLTGIAVDLTLTPNSTGNVSCTFGLGGPVLTTDASGFITTTWGCNATSPGTISLVMFTPGVEGGNITFGPSTVMASGSSCDSGPGDWGVVPLR